MTTAVGIDIGGTKTSAGVVDLSGKLLARREAATPAAEGPLAVLANAVTLARAAIADLGPDSRVVAAGVGAAGVIDPLTRTVVGATDALPAWPGTRIGQVVENALGVPTVVENDVHAHALGEARYGAGRDIGTVLVVAAGTGIGGALVIGGQIQRGAKNLAGHYGHMPAAEAAGIPCTCGGVGHVEMISAGPAVLAGYLHNGGNGSVTDTRDVFALAVAGDIVAREAVRVAGFALGRTVGALINATDPEVVVIAGGLSQTGPEWWTPLLSGVNVETIPAARGKRILAAFLGSDAAIVGAATAALDAEFSSGRSTGATERTS